MNDRSLIIAGRPYTRRLREQLKRECRAWGVVMPSDDQIGAVLHAMADHTAICQMIQFDQLERFPGSSKEGQTLENWPIENSIGRFFHAAGDSFRDGVE